MPKAPKPEKFIVPVLIRRYQFSTLSKYTVKPKLLNLESSLSFACEGILGKTPWRGAVLTSVNWKRSSQAQGVYQLNKEALIHPR